MVNFWCNLCFFRPATVCSVTSTGIEYAYMHVCVCVCPFLTGIRNYSLFLSFGHSYYCLLLHPPSFSAKRVYAFTHANVLLRLILSNFDWSIQSTIRLFCLFVCFFRSPLLLCMVRIYFAGAFFFLMPQQTYECLNRFIEDFIRVITKYFVTRSINLFNAFFLFTISNFNPMHVGINAQNWFICTRNHISNAINRNGLGILANSCEFSRFCVLPLFESLSYGNNGKTVGRTVNAHKSSNMLLLDITKTILCA